MRVGFTAIGLMFSLVLLLSSAARLSAQSDYTTTLENPTRVRFGPGLGFPLVYELPPYSEVRLLGRSPDGAWVWVQHELGLGWLPSNQVQLTGFNPPIEPVLPVEPLRPTEFCISISGDSVAYGSAVYIVPNYGFGILHTAPISQVLSEHLSRRGLGYWEVRDRSVSAAFLSERGRNPYSRTAAYADLMQDRCAFTVVMPWINDLSIPRDEPLQAHVNDLEAFIARLYSQNPNGYLIVLGFYYGQPSHFAEHHAPGYVDANIAEVNHLLDQSCRDTVGGLGQIERVFCWPTEGLFLDPANSHVVLNRTQSQIEAEIVEPIPENVRPFFENYWRDDPNAEVYGDGVHLSEAGKAILAGALLEILLRLDPDM